MFFLDKVFSRSTFFGCNPAMFICMMLIFPTLACLRHDAGRGNTVRKIPLAWGGPLRGWGPGTTSARFPTVVTPKPKSSSRAVIMELGGCRDIFPLETVINAVEGQEAEIQAGSQCRWDQGQDV